MSTVPLSKYAKREVRGVRDYVLFLGVGTAIFLLPFIINYGVVAIVILLALFYIIGLVSYLKMRNVVIRKNLTDYQKSTRLREVFNKLGNTPTYKDLVTDPLIPGNWKPFRVEHHLSDSLRGSIQGSFQGGFLGLGGSFRGYMTGRSVPNLLDSSSIIFLKNDEGNTLRLLVPSNSFLIDLFMQHIDILHMGIPAETFIWEAIQENINTSKRFLATLVHPQTIDQITASLESEFSKRGSLEINGVLVQEGVAIATSIDDGSGKKIFLPSGFFNRFNELINPVMGIQRQLGIGKSELQ